MSYHAPPYGRAHSTASSQHPSLSWGTSSSVTANVPPPPHGPSRGFKASVHDANDAASVYSFGVPSHFSYPSSAGSEQTVRVMSPAGKHDTRSVASQSRSSKHAYSATAPSTAASPSIFNDHVRRMTLSPGACLLHPFLEPGSVWCDFAYPPSVQPGTPNYNPKLTDTAFSPSLQRVVVYFCDNHRWFVSIAHTHDLTVFAILSEIYRYLQLPDDDDASHIPYATGDVRTQSRARGAHPHAFHSGRRRIDTLGRRRVFYGLIPSGRDQQTWLLQLSEPTDENFSI
ncbi:hypothetical protein BJ912DRAFT_1146060 [Pholiota molesta]|nr:hypothetical protein BJ912DRAFT_1146060 [Pholiota molesta]